MLSAGTLVDSRYRIVSLLGRGGMGAVYDALDVRLSRHVALKVLARSLASTHALAARFAREGRATAQLDHPGCVRLHDVGHDAGAHYLVMELLQGPTLSSVIARDGRIRPQPAVEVARALCSALSHAHSRGVLHRDLKPGNVVYGMREGVLRPVLIDFGLAVLRDEQPLTMGGVCPGTPAYVAPERLRENARYDGRADLYSLGVVLHEMIAGVPPFKGKNGIQTARMHLTRPPPPLRAIVPAVSAALEAVVLRALAKEPEHRYSSAEHMLAALDGVALVQRGPPPELEPEPADASAVRRLPEPSDPSNPSGPGLLRWLRRQAGQRR